MTSSTSTERAESLIAEGKGFTYLDFSSKSEYGYPAAFSIEYSAWKIKVDGFLASTFGKSSPVYETFKKGDGIDVIGNESDKFTQSQAIMIGALVAGAEELKFQSEAAEASVPDKLDPTINNRAFIVHGHDEQMKNQL